MKKLMIAAVIVCAAACANAETSWNFDNWSPITGTDGTGVWSGTAKITCEALGYTTDLTVSDGWLDASTKDVSTGNPDLAYTFTLSMTEGNYTYSQTASGRMDCFEEGMYISGSITFTGGNAWVKTGDVPEPTSGLLMLLGMAGLALKRKRV